MREDIVNEYFDWLTGLACGQRYSKTISYKKLFSRLHDIEFTYSIPKDQNRADDGIDLRYRFALSNGYERSYEDILEILEGPCSVLEMMVALSIRCEETIMDDPQLGDRSRQWFWTMMTSLGLGSMTNDRFDIRYVDEVIERFLNRDYEPNGAGGLFTIRNMRDGDMRDVEIWYQLCWYLDSIAYFD